MPTVNVSVSVGMPVFAGDIVPMSTKVLGAKQEFGIIQYTVIEDGIYVNAHTPILPLSEAQSLIDSIKAYRSRERRLLKACDRRLNKKVIQFPLPFCEPQPAKAVG